MKLRNLIEELTKYDLDSEVIFMTKDADGFEYEETNAIISECPITHVVEITPSIWGTI